MIIKTLSWRNYMKGRKGYSLYYMKCVENILNEYICYLNLKEKIRLVVGDFYRTLYFNGIYTLEVPKREINTSNLYNELEFLEVATIIAHEVGHIVNKDAKIFWLYERTLMWFKRNRVLSSLLETRADIFSYNLVMNVYGGYSYNWFQDKVNYKKKGYFDGSTRLFIVQNYQEYNSNVVDFIFENIYKKDKYATIGEIENRIVDDITIAESKQDWMLHLLCVK